MILYTLKDRIQLEGFAVEVSTSDVDYLAYADLVPETCLFWPGGTVVVEKYVAWPQAVQGHVSWLDAERVARAIFEETR